MKNKKFVFQVKEWSVGPEFGVTKSWRKDLNKYIKESDDIIAAIKHNIKVAEKILKKTDDELDAEKFWEPL